VIELRSIRYEIQIIEGGLEIKDLLFKNNIYHPVHICEFAPNTYKTNKKCFCFIIYYENKYYFIPIIYFRNEKKIVYLINYIELPEIVFKISIKELIKKFKVFYFETQRTYNNYSISFLTKIHLDSYVVDLTQGFDHYFNSLGKKTKRNIKYYTKKFDEHFEIKLEYFNNNEFTYDLFLRFIDLVSQRYDSKYWLHLKDEKVFNEFKKDVIAIVGFVDNSPVFYNIYYADAYKKESAVLIGNTFDEKYSKYSLGFIMTFRAIEMLHEKGFKKIILGPGDFGYKNRLANSIEKLYLYKL